MNYLSAFLALPAASSIVSTHNNRNICTHLNRATHMTPQAHLAKVRPVLSMLNSLKGGVAQRPGASLFALSMHHGAPDKDIEGENPFDELLSTEDGRLNVFVSEAFHIADDSALEGELESELESDNARETEGAREEAIVSHQQEHHEPCDVRPRDPELSELTKGFIERFNSFKKLMPEKVVNTVFETAKERIKERCQPGSYVAKLLCNTLDIINGSETPEAQEEYLYLLLKAADILDQTSKTEDETNHTPISLYRSLLLDGLNNLLSSPENFDMFGILNVYKRAFEAVAGDNKNKAYDMLSDFKEGLLSSLGREDVDSLATKVKLVLYIVITIDTGQKIDSDEFVEIFQKLGVIFSKIAQTVGGQANNPIFQDGGTKQGLIEACKELQQYNAPMTEEEARGQMATYYEQQFGVHWEKKMFKSIDYSNPIKTGTIAGIYTAVTADDRQVIVKIKKPIEEKLAMEKIQVAQVLHAVYEIIQEAVSAYERLGRPVPDILSKANLFQRSEASTQRFLERFEAELKLENEAKALHESSCKTPQIFSYTPNAIVMEYVADGVTPFEFIEISDRTTPVNYAKASDPVNAVTGWLKTHYPFDVSDIKVIKTNASNLSSVQVRFKEGSNEVMNFNVKKERSGWKVVPRETYVDFSQTARERIATQSIADLIKQLQDGLLNCDAHAGNFIIAPGDKPGANEFYHIDFGFTATIDSSESKLAWNFVKGLIFKNEEDIAKSYLDMTDRGRTLPQADYDQAVKQFGDVLKVSEYTKMLTENPDEALGPVMEWLAEENFNIDAKFYAIIRSFSGVASNAANMQGGGDLLPHQFMHLSKELLVDQVRRR